MGTPLGGNFWHGVGRPTYGRHQGSEPENPDDPCGTISAIHTVLLSERL
jgi:hypothetical protein